MCYREKPFLLNTPTAYAYILSYATVFASSKGSACQAVINFAQAPRRHIEKAVSIFM